MTRITHTRFNLILAALVVLAIAFFVVKGFWDARNVDYELASDALVIKSGRGVSIPYGEIDTVYFFPEPPPLERSWNIDLGPGRFGRYRIEDLGWVQMYASDPKLPLIVVRAGSESFGLTPADGEGFYRSLLGHLPAEQQEGSSQAGMEG